MRMVWAAWILVIFLGVQGNGQKLTGKITELDFQNMIQTYGHEELRFTLPSRQVLDSLSRPPFVWVDGYRIQVAAVSSPQRAAELADLLKRSLTDSVYVLSENNLFRIQFGDYTDRITAETKVDSMRKYGWPEAWIVTRKVKKWVSPTDSASQPLNHSAKMEADDLTDKVFYSVQIAAFSNRAAAEQFVQQIEKPQWDIRIFPAGDFLKILVGKFASREEAEIQLQAVRQAGFTDAWITEFLNE